MIREVGDGEGSGELLVHHNDQDEEAQQPTKYNDCHPCGQLVSLLSIFVFVRILRQPVLLLLLSELWPLPLIFVLVDFGKAQELPLS